MTEDEDAVRRLLADARHDQPMPAGVVARLERALAAEQGAVADLAPRRRRRWGAGLLAAAAVVVAGVAIGPELVGSTSDDSGAETSASADSAGDDAGIMPVPEAAPGAGQVRDRLSAAIDRYGVALVGSATFDADVVALAGRAPVATPADGAFDCAPAAWGPGALRPVRYDGAPAVVVLRPGGTTADLVRCGTGDILRSAALPRE